MKFKFKIQQYQTDAVEQTVNVFAGQPSKSNTQYRRDLGKRKGQITFEEEYVGWRNNDVELQGHQLLDNIQQQQAIGNIPKSTKLSLPDGLGACSLDIEMETGTGKTYVYIKTMFELNKRYLKTNAPSPTSLSVCPARHWRNYSFQRLKKRD